MNNEMREIVKTFSLLYKNKLITKEQIIRSLSHYMDTSQLIFSETQIHIRENGF